MMEGQYFLYYGDIKIGTISNVESEFLDFYGTFEPEKEFNEILEYEGFLDQIISDLSEDENFTVDKSEKVIEEIFETIDMGIMPTVKPPGETSSRSVLIELSENKVKWRFVEDNAIGRVHEGLDDIWSYISEMVELEQFDRVKASEVLDELNKMMSVIENLGRKEEISQKDKEIASQQLKLSIQGMENKMNSWEKHGLINSEIYDDLLEEFDIVFDRIESLHGN